MSGRLAPRPLPAHAPQVKTSRTLAAAAIALSLSGCAFLRSIAASGFQKPKLEYVSWAPESFDAEGITLAFQYRLTNPNDLGFKLSRIGWALDLEGKPAAKGDMPAGLTVPAKGTAPVTFPVRVRWRDVPDLLKLVATREDVGFKVTGNAAVDGPLGEFDVPFSREGRFDLPRVPGVLLDGVRVRELSLTNVSLDLRLQITNGNTFALPVGALAYGLRLGGEQVASGSGHPLAMVPPGGTATVSIPIRLSLAAAGSALKKLLEGAALPAEVKGKADFGDLEFPFDAEGTAKAPKSPFAGK
jgi:LEA14-like dessication related protein